MYGEGGDGGGWGWGWGCMGRVGMGQEVGTQVEWGETNGGGGWRVLCKCNCNIIS